jgi:hypothetical protein
MTTTNRAAWETTTIAAEYVKGHAAALELLASLQEAIENMPAPGSNQPITWGHVGSLAEFNHQLRNANAFITGTDA